MSPRAILDSLPSWARASNGPTIAGSDAGGGRRSAPRGMPPSSSPTGLPRAAQAAAGGHSAGD
eukprot:9573976-Alexandrium_andersonii.AAC.1